MTKKKRKTRQLESEYCENNVTKYALSGRQLLLWGKGANNTADTMCLGGSETLTIPQASCFFQNSSYKSLGNQYHILSLSKGFSKPICICIYSSSLATSYLAFKCLLIDVARSFKLDFVESLICKVEKNFIHKMVFFGTDKLYQQIWDMLWLITGFSLSLAA